MIFRLHKTPKTILSILMLFAFIVLATPDLYAQTKYTVAGTVKKNKKKLDGAIVTLTKGSALANQITTSTNGRFSVLLDMNAEYTLSVTKPGHITKKFYFNTKGIPEERAKEEFGGQDIEVSIFELPKDPGVVSQINSILSQPIAKFFYDDKIKEIEYDKAYTQSMQDALAKLAQVEKEANAKAEEQVKQQQQLEAAAASQYQAAIAKADAAFAKKDYAGARAAYEDALSVKKGEPYPLEKIKEIEKLQADAAKNAQVENDYKAAIAKADAAFTAKNYDFAKTNYNDALKLKPAEAYPKTKLAEIDAAIAKQGAEKELNAKYEAAIAKGDKAFAAKDYTNAKVGYNEALALKATEKYPKDKIAEIDKALADVAAKEKAEKELNEKYAAAIAKADKALTAKDYVNAKAGYTEALGFKPSEAYPKTKIAEIEKAIADAAAKDAAEKAKLAKEKELNDKYTAAIAKGDKALATKDYVNAKAGYNEALTLKATEQYPKDKIKEIDTALAELAAKDKAEKDKLAAEKVLNEKYTAAITKGDAAMTAKNYSGAKSAYTEASVLKAAEQYPKDKLSEIEKLLSDAAAKDAAEKEKLAKEKELNDKYNAAIAKGDKALLAKTYEAAKAAYNEALGLKPTEQLPKDKIASIDKLLADAAAKDAAEKDRQAKEKEITEKYTAAITKGDKALAAKTYEDAKAAYNEALGIKPIEAYPKTKLAEIEKAIADAASKDAAEKARLAKEKEIAEKYSAAITKADAALSSKDYELAKTAYNEALSFKATEKYPKDKIAEINAILAKEMGAKELEKKYTDAISKGDAALAAKDYATAKTNYSSAIGLKPSEQYPKDKLVEVDKALADAAAEKDRLAKEKELDAKYKAAIAKGDAALKLKTYPAAKSAYNEALTLKATEQYPKDKIAEIDALIAKEMGAKELDEKYKAAIAKGDAALKTKSYEDAKTGYNEALGFKPAEAYPKTKLAEIDKAIADAAAKDAADKDRLSKEKELTEKYSAAITKADAALASKDYDLAKTAYNEALSLKATEKYPKDKIAEINAILAKEMGAKELEKKYTESISKGDAALNAKDYATAKTNYSAAIGLKPSEQYPKDKLAEVEKNLAEIAATKDKEAAEKAKEAKYKAAIAKGDAAMTAKTYTAAKTAYNEALSVKPGEQYPTDKIAEADKLMGDAAAEKDRVAIEAKYKAAIAKGDAAMTAKTYTAAKTAYNEALTVKPGEQYPTDKIAEADKLMGDVAAEKDRAAIEAKYKVAIAKGDAALKAKTYEAAKTAYNDAIVIKSEQYPKDKIAEINKVLDELASKNASAKELDEKYKAAITKADAALVAKSYADAKSGYNEALSFKPAEKYPKDKLVAIDAIIAGEANAKEKDEKYNAAIASADQAFAAKDYVKAKTSYTEAIGVKSTEQYPKDQLTKVNAIIADLAKGKAAQEKYDAAIKNGDDAVVAKDYSTALASYKEAQALKPSEPYPANKIAEVNRALDAIEKGKAKEQQFKDLVAKGDKLLASKDLKMAKSAYQDALLIKASDAYVKAKIAEVEALMKKGGTTAAVTGDPKNNKDDFKNALVEKYPEGITEESARENNAKVTRRIVVKGKEGHMYVKKETSFGPVYFFKDDVPITEQEYLRDTEVENN
jgi:hypothetical protein